jgi:general secretion pathway protein N
MNRVWPLVALGIGAFIVFALVTLPAEVVLSRVASPAISFSGVSGTLWNGRAQALRVAGIHAGSAEWDLHVLSLFTGRLSADVKLTRTDGFAQGEVTVTPSGQLALEGFTASFPASALPANVAQGGWGGTLNLKLSSLVLEDAWPTQADGTIEAVDLVGPASKPAEIGSYRIAFTGADASAGVLSGALTDLGGGPLQVAGTVQLKPDRSYLVEGLIATRPNAPASIANALQYLPPPDAQGRRQFSFEGSM